MHRLLVLFAAAAMLGPYAPHLSAQQLVAPQTPSTQRPVLTVAPVQAFTFNPIGIAAGFFSAEYERRVSPNVSLSVGASYFDLGTDFDKVSYLAGDLRARFYPRRALDGLAIGVSLGAIRTGSRSQSFSGTADGYSDSDNGITLGTTVEHTWLLGAQNRYLFSLGGGFKRLLLLDGKQPNVETFYPTLRTSFGFTF